MKHLAPGVSLAISSSLLYRLSRRSTGHPQVSETRVAISMSELQSISPLVVRRLDMSTSSCASLPI
jgi:hypothetical protein